MKKKTIIMIMMISSLSIYKTTYNMDHIFENWRRFLLEEEEGKFVHGFKKEDVPDFNFDQFYDKLDSAGLAHLLGNQGKDYKYGKAHDAARSALTDLDKDPETTNVSSQSTQIQSPQPTTDIQASDTQVSDISSITTQTTPGYTTETERILQGKLESNQNRSHSTYVPAGIDFSQPVTVQLYFHGMGSSHNKVDLLKSRVPAGSNTILIVPNLTHRPQNRNINLSSTFVRDAINQISSEYGQNLQIGNVQTFAHSAGGKTMGNYLNSLSDDDLNQVSNIKYLDATYGWNATGRLMDRINRSGYDPSRIHFMTRDGRTQKYANRYVNSGARFSNTRLSHGRSAYEIGNS